MKKTLLAIATATSFMLGGAAHAEDKLKIGFIYIGPPGDFGWTYQHDQARKELVEALGDKIETTFLENVPEGADAERSIERLARAGTQIVMAVHDVEDIVPAISHILKIQRGGKTTQT